MDTSQPHRERFPRSPGLNHLDDRIRQVRREPNGKDLTKIAVILERDGAERRISPFNRKAIDHTPRLNSG